MFAGSWVWCNIDSWWVLLGCGWVGFVGLVKRCDCDLGRVFAFGFGVG